MNKALDLIRWLFEMWLKAQDKGLDEFRLARSKLREAKRVEGEEDKDFYRSEAVTAIRHAIRRGLPGLDEYLDAADIAEELGEITSATKAYRRAVWWWKHPRAVEARIRLALLLVKQRQTQRNAKNMTIIIRPYFFVSTIDINIRDKFPFF